MAMNHTPGFIKAVVDISYINNLGIKHHMMSFQLATADTHDHKAVERVRAKAAACEHDHTQMQGYIRDCIAAVEKNDYQLFYEFSVQA